MNVKEIVKTVLRNCPLTKKKFGAWEEKRAQGYMLKKNQILHRNGYKLIEEVQSALNETEEIFFFDFGTLLGIIREGKIISHDMDMDVGVCINGEKTIQNTREALLKAGCVHEVIDYVGDDIVGQDTFSKYGIEFDIYYYRSRETISEVLTLFRDPQKKYSGELWDVVSLTSKPVLNTVLYSFQGNFVSVPEFYEEHLINRYGPNWRIPDKNYVYWDSFSSKITNLQGYMKKVE